MDVLETTWIHFFCDVVSGLVIDLTLLLEWELLGIYVIGIALEVCDCRLQIGYVDDLRFIWYTFGGMDSWIDLALAMGAILAMDILTTMDTCDYLWIRFLHLAF